MKNRDQPIYTSYVMDLPEGRPVLVDLGCGSNKTEGYYGLDQCALPGVDVYLDLSQHAYPFQNETVDHVRAIHLMEYLDGYGRIFMMNECHRILRPGKWLDVTFYYATSRMATMDPMYKWPPLTEFSFEYFKRDWREANGFTHYGIECDFDVSYTFDIEESLVTRNQEFKWFASRHYNHSVSRMHVTLTKRSR